MPKPTEDTMAKNDPAPDAPKTGDDQPKAEAKPTLNERFERECQTREQWLNDVRKRASEQGAKLLPEEWLEVVFPGEVMPNGALRRQGGHDAARHGAAAALHGWAVDAHHAPQGGRLRLTREDYESALKAAAGKGESVEKLRTEPTPHSPRHPGKRKAAGPPKPHEPALSKWPAKLRELAGVK